MAYVNLINMTSHDLTEAKRHLLPLLEAALRGEDDIIVRGGKPLVRLVPVERRAPRELGFLDLPTPDDGFDPLAGSDLARWS